VREGKPGNTNNYTIRKFDGIKVYVSNTLLNKQVTIDLAGFLRWKWLKIKEA